jgi:hypothetical protein
MEAMSGFDNVDDDDVKTDIQELSNELKSFGEELSMIGEGGQGGYWFNQSLDDCKGALACLEQVLEDARKVEAAGVPSVRRTLDFKSRGIALLREFTAYRWMIRLLRLSITYVS